MCRLKGFMGEGLPSEPSAESPDYAAMLAIEQKKANQGATKMARRNGPQNTPTETTVTPRTSRSPGPTLRAYNSRRLLEPNFVRQMPTTKRRTPPRRWRDPAGPRRRHVVCFPPPAKASRQDRSLPFFIVFTSHALLSPRRGRRIANHIDGRWRRIILLLAFLHHAKPFPS